MAYKSLPSRDSIESDTGEAQVARAICITYTRVTPRMIYVEGKPQARETFGSSKHLNLPGDTPTPDVNEGQETCATADSLTRKNGRYRSGGENLLDDHCVISTPCRYPIERRLRHEFRRLSGSINE